MFQRFSKLLFIIPLFVVVYANVNAQITVEQTLTIEEYVNDFLLGEGVTATNITFTGSETQIATMMGGEGTIFPVASGLVLATSDLSQLNFDGTPFFDANPPDAVSGDPDLLSVANSVPPLIGQSFSVGSVNDVAVLEFDFVPNGDTLKFDYVFGSDEYLTWVNSSYNDIFAFFLSGPGLSGPYASPAGFPDGAINIAQVPESAPPLPITISSVNDVLNSTYYNDNPGNTDISIKGFTDTLQAVSAVQCGELYHIKIAIADGSDTALESIVVLEEGSFTSDQAIQTELQLNIGTTTNVLYENCGVGSLVFTRFGDLEEPATVELEVTGAATNGVDFTFIPNEVFFGAGDSVTTFEVTAVADGVPEGVENVVIDVTNTVTSACGLSVTTQFTFDVYDDPEALALEGGDFSIECGDSVLVGGLVTGGYGEYTYTWTANGQPMPLQQDSTFYATPGVTTEYILQVDDICNAGTITATYNVTVPVYPELVVDIDESVDLVCLDEITISVNSATGGYGDYTYEWYQDTLIGTGTSIDYVAYNTTQIMVVMTDECGLTATDVMQVNVPPIPIIIEMSPDQNICLGDVVQVSADVSGGKPPYLYQWNTSVLNTDELTVNPNASQVYELTITDQCFHSESNTTTVQVSEVIAMFTRSELDYYGVEVKNHTQADNGGTMSYFWDFGDGFTSTAFELTHMYTDISDHIISLTAISDMGCRDSVAYEIEAPKPVFIPSSFSPNGDGINDLFFVTGDDLEEYELQVFDRWGQIIFQSNDIEEKWNGHGIDNENYFTSANVYNYILNIRPKAGDRKKMTGTITVLR